VKQHVIRYFHRSLLPTENATERTNNNIPALNVPICHQKIPHVFLPSIFVSERRLVNSDSLPSLRFKLVIFVVALKSLNLFIVHQMPNAPEANKRINEREKVHNYHETGLKSSFSSRDTPKPIAATENVSMRLIE